jgi:hypothetical protein
MKRRHSSADLFSEWFYRTGAFILGWVCIGLTFGGYGFLVYRDITRVEVPPQHNQPKP